MLHFQLRRFFCLLLIYATISACSTTNVIGTINVPSNKGIAISTVSISKFKDNGSNLGEEIRTAIASKISNQGHVKVISMGAEAQLKGSISMGRITRDSWSEKYKSDDEIKRRYYYQVQKSISASYELNQNQRIFSDSHNESYSQTWSSDQSSSDARRQSINESEINSRLIERIATRIANDITPHKEARDFTFKHGKDANFKIGIKYVEHQRYDQAISIFRQVAENTLDIEDRATATYNLGVIFEMQGQFEKAFEKYRDANQMVLNEEDYITALSRAEKHYKLQQEFLRQTEQ
jgi:tetratricopeptide (TPR) repeat protein